MIAGPSFVMIAHWVGCGTSRLNIVKVPLKLGQLAAILT